jgi:hypothetical protein
MLTINVTHHMCICGAPIAPNVSYPMVATKAMATIENGRTLHPNTRNFSHGHLYFGQRIC